MTQKNTKTFGRSPESLNAPIAAFTMALILCSYCFISIRTARREAQDRSVASPGPPQRASQTNKNDSSWVKQALEEEIRAKENGRGGTPGK